MRKKINIYGIVQGKHEEQWIASLTLHPEVEIAMSPRRLEEILPSVEVLSIRKCEVVEHEEQ